MNIKRKKNLPVAFGEVRQTTNTPTIIARLVKKANAPTAVAVGCVDHHEYSLMKILYIYIMMIQKNRKRYTKVLDSLEISSFC